jgi:hypothetical protein
VRRACSDKDLEIAQLTPMQSFPPTWSKCTTSPNVVWLTTLTTYESATGAPASPSGLISISASPTSNATIPMTAATNATSSSAANALSGYEVGLGIPGTLALAVCFAAVGVTIVRRRL